MWFHVILYGLAMAVIFALTLCLVSYIDPQAFTKMYPPAIQKIALQIPPESRKTEVVMLVCLWTFMVLFSITSNYLSGVRGFGQLFLAGYIQFFMVDMGDFFGWNILFNRFNHYSII